MPRVSLEVYDKGCDGSGHFLFNLILRLRVHPDIQHCHARHRFVCPYPSCSKYFTTEDAVNQVRPLPVVSRAFQILLLTSSQHCETNHRLRCAHCPDTFPIEGGKLQVRHSIIVLKGGDEVW